MSGIRGMDCSSEISPIVKIPLFSMRAGRVRFAQIVYLEAAVVESPVEAVLEEIRISVGELEGGVQIVG